jgi:amidase
MIVVSDKNWIYYHSKDNPPVARIPPGEEFIVDAPDTAGGALTSEDFQFPKPYRGIQPGKSNPLAGPIAIDGAKPGDTLVIEVLDIEPAPSGYIATVPGVALGNSEHPKVRIVKIENGEISFGDRFRLKVRPMIGTIGVAPADAPMPTTHNMPFHGGNLDIVPITKGSKIYLPISVEGALLALGDCHACQGDGELAGSAVEISARVRLRCNLMRGQRPRPWIETATAWYTIATGPELDSALRLAIADMADLLEDKLDISREDANMLITAAGSGRLGQAGGWTMDVSVACEFPKWDQVGEIVQIRN